MATNNAVNNGLSGATGSGSFVGSTSPTLVTPTLGVASATSIDFGGGALSSYVPLTAFTPTFTFATPGDLSVAYSIQDGFYVRIGDLVYFSYACRFTPTYTTASGIPRFGGLPLTSNTAVSFRAQATIAESTTWPVGVTQLVGTVNNNVTYATIAGYGTAIAATALGTTQFPTATQRTVVITGFYSV